MHKEAVKGKAWEEITTRGRKAIKNRDREPDSSIKKKCERKRKVGERKGNERLKGEVKERWSSKYVKIQQVTERHEASHKEPIEDQMEGSTKRGNAGYERVKGGKRNREWIKWAWKGWGSITYYPELISDFGENCSTACVLRMKLENSFLPSNSWVIIPWVRNIFGEDDSRIYQLVGSEVGEGGLS